MNSASAGTRRRLGAGLVLVLGLMLVLGAARIAMLAGQTGIERHYDALSVDEVVSELVETGRPPSAAIVAAARDDVMRHPFAAEPLLVLGATRIAKHEPGGDALVAAALRDDPRLSQTYSWLLQQALRSGDVVQATHSTMRLLALNPHAQDSYIPVLVGLTQSEVARGLIEAAMRQQPAPFWASTYASALSGSKLDPAIVFEVIGDKVQAQAIVQQRAFLERMIRQHDYDRAFAAWVGWLPQSALSAVDYIYDGEFHGRPGPTPFNWELGDTGDGVAAIDGSKGLALTMTGREAATLATQTILLRPGTYQLISTQSLDAVAGETASPPLDWKLNCVDGGAELTRVALAMRAGPVRVDGRSFTVPETCPAQQLVLEARPMDLPTAINGHVRSVAIRKVGA